MEQSKEQQCAKKDIQIKELKQERTNLITDIVRLNEAGEKMADALKLCEDCIPNKESLLSEQIEQALTEWNNLT